MAKFDTLFDNFNDNSISGAKWTSYGSTSETNQRLELTAPASSTAYSGLVSATTYDLTASFIKLKVVNAGNQSLTTFEFYPLQAYLNGSNSLFWYINSGTIKAFKKVAGVTTQLATATYSSSTHAYLRIREASGTTYFDYSADGSSWTNFTSLANPFTLTSLTYEASAGKYTVVATATTAIIDDFNVTQLSASGSYSGDSIFSATPYINYSADISFSGDSILTAYIPPAPQDLPKDYYAKVYDIEDNFLEEWHDELVSDISFSEQINSAGPSLDLLIGRTSDVQTVAYDELADEEGDDNIATEEPAPIAALRLNPNSVGPGTAVNYGNKIELWVSYGYIDVLETQDGQSLGLQQGDNIEADIGSVNGRKLFTGYIARYVSNYGNTENTLITLNSYGQQLDKYVIESGGSTDVSYFSQDPSDILRSIIDIANSSGAEASYDNVTVSDTNTVASYDFKLSKILDGVNKTLELAPSDWYWYYDPASNLIWWKPKPATPDHIFTLGVHIKNLDVENHIENLVNKVYFKGGRTSADGVTPEVYLYKTYQDTTSINTYGLFSEIITDDRVTRDDTADILGQGRIDRLKDPQNRSTLEISSSVYPIEDIRPGESIGFSNFGNYVDDLVLQVVGKDYAPDAVRLQLDSLLPDTNKRIEDIKRNLRELETITAPSTPT